MAPLTSAFELRYFSSLASLQSPLNREPSELELLAVDCDSGAAYTKYYIVIRGKRRVISIPNHSTDSVQKNINELFFPGDFYLSEAVNGYVRDRSIRSNAGRHVDAKYLLHLDIQDFFNAITEDHVFMALSGLGFGDEAARMLTRLVTTEGSVPLGARTSPRVSNYVLRAFDEALSEIAKRENLVFSRYADDLAFSGQEPFEIRDEISDLLQEFGFRLNESKSKAFKLGQPMFVTGLSVGLADYPRLRKRFKSTLRAEFYYVEKYGLEEHATFKGADARRIASRLMGQFNFARGIEPAFAEALAAKFPKTYKRLIPQRDEGRLVRLENARADFANKVRGRSEATAALYLPTTPMS